MKKSTRVYCLAAMRTNSSPLSHLCHWHCRGSAVETPSRRVLATLRMLWTHPNIIPSASGEAGMKRQVEYPCDDERRRRCAKAVSTVQSETVAHAEQSEPGALQPRGGLVSGEEELSGVLRVDDTISRAGTIGTIGMKRGKKDTYSNQTDSMSNQDLRCCVIGGPVVNTVVPPVVEPGY